MSLNLLSERHQHSIKLLGDGIRVGIAGGLAEVAVVGLYSAISDTNIATVGRQIAATVGLDSQSALSGLWVHLALSAALGIVLMSAWNMLRTVSSRSMTLYSSASMALAAIWVMNFVVVLPVLNPDFVTLLPYAITFLSKLMFGLTAARVAQFIFATRTNSMDGKSVDTYNVIPLRANI
jgi:hypothetical protein